MRSTRRRRTRQLKWVLSAVIIASLSMVIFLFSQYQRRHDPVDPPATDPAEEATITVGRVEHTATRHGRVEWRLSADAVRYLDAEKKAVFEGVEITFFTQDGREIHLAAQTGELDTETQNIRISGEVRVESDPYQLKTEQLRYVHEQKRFTADRRVQVESEGFHLSADGMTFQLDDRKADLRGNVEGVIHDRIEF